jgi:hypothetical protein
MDLSLILPSHFMQLQSDNVSLFPLSQVTLSQAILLFPPFSPIFFSFWIPFQKKGEKEAGY